MRLREETSVLWSTNGMFHRSDFQLGLIVKLICEKTKMNNVAPLIGEK